MRRPMAFAAPALGAGILLDWGFRPCPQVLAAAVILILLAGWRCRRAGRWANLCVILLLVAAGAIRAEADERDRLSPPAEPVPVTAEGTLLSGPELNRSGRVQTAWFLMDSPGAGKVQLSLPSGAGRFLYGERLRLSGMIRPGRLPRPGGRFDERRWLWVHGAGGVLSVTGQEGITHLEEGAGLWTRYRRWVDRLRRALAFQARSLWDSDEAGLLEGLLLGEGRGISPETWENFRRTGTIHVLVVSGLHVGLLGFISLTLLAVMRVPRVARRLLLAGILITYCLLTGMNPPIVRSTLTGLLLCWAQIRGLESSPANLLGAAAAAILAAQPRALADVSFQLSFAAVAGLMVGSAFIGREQSVPGTGVFLRRLKQMLAVSFGAWVATAPLIAWHFRSFSLITPFANLVVVPWSSLVITVGFAACGLGLLAPAWAAAPFAAAFTALAKGLTLAVAWAAGLPGACWKF